AHATAVAESRGESLGRVDAQRRFHGCQDVVDERDVLTAGVRPGVVEALRGDEHGAAVRERLEAVVALVRHVPGGAVPPVRGDHEAVRVVRVVPGGYVEAEGAGLSAAVDGVVTGGQSGRLAAAVGAGGLDDGGLGGRACRAAHLGGGRCGQAPGG